ncbi:SpoIID/LytB domain-containing protein [Cytobacillus firmus]|uniref:N-acetylmuramoyl-L-alanine amidase (Major autolysin) (CWBP49) n=1 Tax=Cytobacillus firmus TaxID=1399 RepID=A0A800NBE1_CYTFI|nr:SpoIID/LytB domain-containing protein [Cytobacillus firmus]KAF0824990.1 N-acetylmuramoyl-L-alanine amidase (major autolysin) (CWBP49) [Cytobacillus firmus]
MYFKRILSFVVVFALIMSMGNVTAASASTDTISVKLSNYIGKKTELSFSLKGLHSIKEDTEGEIDLEEGKLYKVKVISGKLTLYSSTGTKIKEFGTTFTVQPENYSTGNVHTIHGNTVKDYLGDIKFTIEDSKYVRPINTDIPFEDYLKGVVPHEMPASWNLEAVKAQAVAARTYSAGKIGQTVADTQAFQVYGGYEWHPNSSRAVEETAGKVLKYNGSRISAVYSSSNGGFIEASSNLWGYDHPYLPAKEDPYDPVRTWSVTYNKDQIDPRKLDLKNPGNWWASTYERNPDLANNIKNSIYTLPDYKNTEIKIVRIPEIKFIGKNSSGRSLKASMTVEFFVKDKAAGSFRMENGNIKTFTVTQEKDANSMRSIFGAGNMKSTLVTGSEVLGHTRLGGMDRFDVAINVSKNGWSSASTVVLANWEAFGDALAAAPLAYKHNGPLLLTKPKSLTPRIKDEIKRLKAKNVIIVGGPISVSDGIVSELKAMGISVKRLAGNSRMEVAENIAKELGSSSKVVIADGFNFPDALSIAPYAARNGYPILLTNNKHTLTKSTDKLIDSMNISQTIISGGPLSVSDAVYNSVPNPRRFGGNHRHDVSANIANAYFGSSANAFITRGDVFADALTGSVLAAKKNAPILLIQPESLTSAIEKSIANNVFDQFTILGGPISVNESVANNLPNVSVNFSGAGFGHGIGMSQYGANSMASKGKKYSEILAFYYPGAKLTDN